jgi:hypothetical protein
MKVRLGLPDAVIAAQAGWSEAAVTKKVQTRQKQTKLAIGIFARCPAYQCASELSSSKMVVKVDA